MLMTALVFLASLAHADQRVPQILRVSVACEGQRSSSDDAAVLRLLKTHNRGARVRSLIMDWPCEASDNLQAEALTEFTRRLAEVVVNQPAIDLLSLSLPPGDADRPERMFPLGQIGNNGLDARMRAALEPLRHGTNDHLKIVLTADKGLTGTSVAAASRARSLTGYLNASSGEVFGFTQNASLPWRPAWTDLAPWKLIAIGATSIDLVMSFNPKFTFVAAGLAIASYYSVRHAGRIGTAKYFAPDTKFQKTFARLENSVASMLGTLIVSAIYLNVSDFTVPTLRNIAVVATVLTAIVAAYPSLKHNVLTMVGFRLDQYNAGRIFTLKPDGTFRVRAAFLGDRARTRQIFSCEDFLKNATPANDDRQLVRAAG